MDFHHHLRKQGCKSPTKQYSFVHVIGPDGHVMASGRTNLEQSIITEIVECVKRANEYLKTIPETSNNYKAAVERFFRENPEPFICSGKSNTMSYTSPTSRQPGQGGSSAITRKHVRGYLKAKKSADYWQEFSAGSHRFVLSRYKDEPHNKRSRYSLFIFPNGGCWASRSFNFEPEDWEDIQDLRPQLDAETDPELRTLLEMEIDARVANPVTDPTAFYGDNTEDIGGSTHSTHGEAPNDLTIEQFRPVAFEWAASLLKISASDIVPVDTRRDSKAQK